MEGPNFADWPCSIARVMDIIGDRWTLLVLRDVFHGIRRFDEFQSSLGIARNTLSDRLNRLAAAGLLTTRLYQDNPPRKEYLLTEMGSDFFPVMASMVTWGDRWLDGGAGPPIDLHHATCGHNFATQSACAECGKPLALSDVTFRLGRGFAQELAAWAEGRPRFETPAKAERVTKRSGATPPSSEEEPPPAD